MEIIIEFTLCPHELYRLLISMDVCLLPKNVVIPLSVGLYNRINFFVIRGALMDAI
jgi:hypothetical protein